MRYLLTIVATCALMLGSAPAQSYPSAPPQDQQQTVPQTQQQTTVQNPQVYESPQPQNQVQNQQVQSQQVQNQQTIAQNGVIPAGSQLEIRTNENIVADKSAVGRQYQAEIANDIVDQSGQVIVPKGSPATLTVANVSSGTAGLQSNEVALALQSVSVNGRTINVQANDVQRSGDRGIGANKRTAVMTGGGALLGTLVGAMAGGGKGAAIGAVLGAGGGAAAQVLTKGSEVKVPAESLLTFKLDQPLSLQ